MAYSSWNLQRPCDLPLSFQKRKITQSVAAGSWSVGFIKPLGFDKVPEIRLVCFPNQEAINFLKLGFTLK